MADISIKAEPRFQNDIRYELTVWDPDDGKFVGFIDPNGCFRATMPSSSASTSFKETKALLTERCAKQQLARGYTLGIIKRERANTAVAWMLPSAYK